MPLFATVDPNRLPEIRLSGLREGGRPVRLWPTLGAARAAHPGDAVLVVDDDVPLSGARRVDVHVEAAMVPAEAIRNLDPYLSVRPIAAGGGYVIREGDSGPEVLMIHRNGRWDLPKGKLDDGESPEAGALREVREEVGIERLRLEAPFGTTVHGYAREGVYWVKTTYWYRMHTDETSFVPQTEEGIDRVEWVPWIEARRRVGYDSLQTHMASLEVEGGEPGRAAARN